MGLGRMVADLPVPNDGTVALVETEITGATDRCTFDVSHVGMLFSSQVADAVAQFLAHGSFGRA